MARPRHAFFAAFAALCLFATPALALEGALIETTVPSANVPGPVPVIIWHTADISAPSSAIYITERQGAENRPRSA
jgi:hypothetical protein